MDKKVFVDCKVRPLVRGFGRFIGAGLVAVSLATLIAKRTQAADVPSLEMTKQALMASKSNWVAFRNYNGRQLVYFTQLVAWKCGLKEIRFIINDDGEMESWPLTECNPDTPYDVSKDTLYVSLPLGTADIVSVQVVFNDGNETELVTFAPCDVEGDTTCGRIVD